MANYEFTPVTMMALSDEKQIRAYVHPVRMILLEMLAKEKQSVTAVARALGVHPANLTHHFKLLEQTGLIKLVEKRDTGRNFEKLYRAAAHHFTVNAEGEPLTDKKVLALSILHDNLTAAIREQKHRTDDRTVFGYLKGMQLRPEGVARFHQKLVRLLDEFASRPEKGGTAYTVNVSFYPGAADQGTERSVMIRDDD
jgi:DNA-binding transcriptional ArsR family regulator